jgi:hypothetical protein
VSPAPVQNSQPKRHRRTLVVATKRTRGAAGSACGRIVTNSARTPCLERTEGTRPKDPRPGTVPGRGRYSNARKDLIPLLGATAFLAGTALFVCVCRGRASHALASLGLGAGTLLAAGSWLDPGWSTRIALHPGNIAIVVLVFFAGLFAALLSAPAERLQEEV